MPYSIIINELRPLNNFLPAVVSIATIVQNEAMQIANMATDNAPMYIAITEAKKTAKNPSATAKDTKSEITMALKVAARTNNRKTNSPVKETREIVPTCNIPGSK